MRQLALGVRLRERATFDTFVVADNAQAVSQVRGIAEFTSINVRVAWLCGASGSGKTHLLQAACAAAAAKGQRAAYIPLEECIALGAGVFDGIADIDLLCIDSVAAAAGLAEFELALFGIFRDREERAARWLLAARSPPSLVSFALRDLGSRLAALPIFQLRELDDEQQLQALQQRASLRGFELPRETALYLQRHLPRDMHSMTNVLDRLDDAALEAQRRITVPFIREVLER